MAERTKTLRDSPIDWLLERTNPSVRYFTLRQIMGKAHTDPEVLEAKRRIPESAPVQRIMQKQNPAGYWEKPGNPYLPKYKSSYWTLMVLGSLGMDRTHETVARACEFIFQFQHDDGGFCCDIAESASRTYEYRLRKGWEHRSREESVSSLIFESQLSCLTGNMVAALVRMGFEDDPRVRKAVDWLVRVQNKDGGWLCPHWKAHAKDKHGCFMGTICPMEAFGEMRSEGLTKEMRAAISAGSEFLLAHRLFRADHHNGRVIKPLWLELGFPWFYDYSTLRGLDVLTKLGYVSDPRLRDAVEDLLLKRQGNGTWILERSPAGRMQTDLERVGQPSKWITLIALRILKRLRA